MQRRTVTRALLALIIVGAGWAVHAALGASPAIVLPVTAAVAVLAPFALYRPDWSEFAWFQGARTEMRVGHLLEELGPGYVVLHEVDVEGAGTIDHVVIASTGIYAVAANAYTGAVEAGWGGQLFMGGYDLRGVVEQVSREAAALAARIRRAGVEARVRPVIAFTRARLEWPRHAGDVLAIAASGLPDHIRAGARVLGDRERALVRAALMPEQDRTLLRVRAVTPDEGPELRSA